jgi:hypothetical protein
LLWLASINNMGALLTAQGKLDEAAGLLGIQP